LGIAVRLSVYELLRSLSKAGTEYAQVKRASKKTLDNIGINYYIQMPEFPQQEFFTKPLRMGIQAEFSARAFRFLWSI